MFKESKKEDLFDVEDGKDLFDVLYPDDSLEEFTPPVKKPLTENEVHSMIQEAIKSLPKPEVRVIEKIVQQEIIKEEADDDEEEDKTEEELTKLNKEIESLKKQIDNMNTSFYRSLNSIPVRIGKIIPSLSQQNGKFLSVSGNKMVWATAGSSTESTGVAYFGDQNTDGSWRIITSGSNLAVERRESGSWVEKGAFQP